MGKTTEIAWCDSTFNPWIGCTKVSPGCAHCYAESLNARHGWTQWGDAGQRHRTSEHNWNEPVRWNRAALKSGQRPRVFCASLADWLDEKTPDPWRADLLNLIQATPHLDWLLLTKRPHSWHARLRDIASLSPVASLWLAGQPPHNVWIGVSIEDQLRAEYRMPALVDIPARIKFLSVEPLLGPLDLSYWITAPLLPQIQWLIVGGESGPHARPMSLDWVYPLKRECAQTHVAFFMKQMGGPKKPFPPIPADLLIRQFPAVV